MEYISRKDTAVAPVAPSVEIMETPIPLQLVHTLVIDPISEPAIPVPAFLLE